MIGQSRYAQKAPFPLGERVALTSDWLVLLSNGPISKLREGDMIRLDGESGTLEVLIDAETCATRKPSSSPKTTDTWDLGCSLFALSRAQVTPADQDALSMSCGLLGECAHPGKKGFIPACEWAQARSDQSRSGRVQVSPTRC